MRTRIITVTALALGLTLTLLPGCGGGGGGITGSTAEYLPLTVGNWWRYNFTDNTSTTTTASVRRTIRPRSTLIHTAQITGQELITISGTTEIGGSQWFVATLQFVGGGTPEDRYLRHNATGLLWKDTLTDAGYYRLKTPVQVGTTWGVPFNANETLSVVGVGETVSVAAGTFTDCAVVDDTITASGQPDDVLTSWFQRGVGLVREEEHLGTTLVYEAELNASSLVVAPTGQ